MRGLTKKHVWSSTRRLSVAFEIRSMNNLYVLIVASLHISVRSTTDPQISMLNDHVYCNKSFKKMGLLS